MGRSWTSACSKTPTGNKQSIYSGETWEVGEPHPTECGRVSEEGPRPQGATGADRITWPEMRCGNTWPPQRNTRDSFSTLKTGRGGTRGTSMAGYLLDTHEPCGCFCVLPVSHTQPMVSDHQKCFMYLITSDWRSVVII